MALTLARQNPHGALGPNV